MKRASQPVVQHALGILFVLLALGYRGTQFFSAYLAEPERLGLHDSRYQYTGAHAWVAGLNPYHLEDVTPYFPVDGHAITPYPYPPNALPLIAPLGFMDYREAQLALAVVNTLSIFMIAGALLWMGLTFTRRRGAPWGILASWLGAAFALVNSVAVVNIWLGQLTAFPAACAILGIALACRNRVIAGSGLAAIGAIKPQLVVFLLPMMMIRWPKRAIITIAAVGILMCLPALLTIGLPSMITDWLKSVKFRADLDVNAPGSVITFGIRYVLVDLGLPFLEVAPAGIALLVVAWCYRRRLGDMALLILTLPMAVLFFPAMVYYQIVAAPVLALLLWYAAGRPWALALATLALLPAIKVLPPLLPMIGERQQELWLLAVTLAVMVIGIMHPEPAKQDAPAPA